MMGEGWRRMNKTDIRKMTFDFALDIIHLYKRLISKNEYVLSKQVLRSGTSIGANVEEAQAAQTKKNFITKMSIASKEARETNYWLRLLRESKIIEDLEISDNLFESLRSIINILTKIVKTSQRDKKLK